MLELIVLGEIPGTDIVISFPVALALLAFFFGLNAARVTKHKIETISLPKIEEITI